MCFVDPTGLIVYQMTNEVAEWSGTNNHHTFLLLVPDNMKDFTKTESADLFQEYTFTNENGDDVTVQGIILRAGPQNDDTSSFLEAQTNFRDNPDDSRSLDIITSSMSDTDFINSLLEHHQNYQERQGIENGVPDYTVPPLGEILWWGQERTENLTGHNSNSYINGLIQSSGGNSVNPEVKTPLYDNPVPSGFYQLMEETQE